MSSATLILHLFDDSSFNGRTGAFEALYLRSSRSESASGRVDVRDRKEYLREYQRKWRAKRRADWFSANGPCARCGSVDNLELDHIDPSVKIHHNVWSWSGPRRVVELAKCQALCEECHKQKTIDEQAGQLVHSANGYMRHKCRCEVCRIDYSRWRRLKYQRTKN